METADRAQATMGMKRLCLAALRMTLPLALVLVMLSALLMALRIEQAIQDLARDRGVRMAAQVKVQIEQGFRLGLSLVDQANLTGVLQSLQDPDMQAAWVQASDGAVLAALGSHAVQQHVSPGWTAQLLALEPYRHAVADGVVRSISSQVFIGSALVDAAGQRAGVLWLTYDRERLRSSVWLRLAPLWPYALAALVILILGLTSLLLFWLHFVRQQACKVAGFLEGNRLPTQYSTHAVGTWRTWGIASAAMLITLLTLALLAFQGRELSRPLLLEQMDQNSSSVLHTVSAQLMRALTLGIPVAGVAGVEALFAQELVQAPEVTFMALEGLQGEPRIFTMQPQAPLAEVQHARQWWAEGSNDDFRLQRHVLSLDDGTPVAMLDVGTPLSRLDANVRSIMLDLALAMLVGLVLVRELMGMGWSRSSIYTYWVFSQEWMRLHGQLLLPAQAHGRNWQSMVEKGLARVQQLLDALRGGVRVGDAASNTVSRVRLIVFLTALSDELLRPFLAVFAAEALPWDAALAPATLAGLPVMTFMLALALAQPLGPVITRRMDSRWAMAGCALLGAVLLLLTGLSRESSTLIALRAASGLVYGLLTILAQTTIVRVTNEASRARGLVEVSAAIVAAGVCGPALGGLLVERLGMSVTFGVAGLFLLLAFLVAVNMPRFMQGSASNPPGMGGWRGLLAVLTNRKVLAVTWLTAVPARLAAVAILVVITPLYLQAQGESVTVSGRVLLLYFLVFMCVAPWAARYSDRSGRRLPWVILGGAVSAAACMAMVLVGGVAGAALCCALLGLGQALMSAPQLAMVTEAFNARAVHGCVGGATPTQALATFRFVERVGSIAAPLVVSMAVAHLGMVEAVAVVGGILAVGTALMLPFVGWPLRGGAATLSVRV